MGKLKDLTGTHTMGLRVLACAFVAGALLAHFVKAKASEDSEP
jgi:hypothetical protein